MIGLKKVLLFTTILCCMFSPLSSCATPKSDNNPVVSVRLRYCSGIFMKNEYPEASGLNNYVMIDAKVDDFSFSSPQAIQALIDSLHNSNPLDTDVEMEYVELVYISLRRANGADTAVYVLYDYISQSEYALFEGDLYILQTNAFTDEFLKPYFLNKYGDQGESRFCNNENHTFRYFHHWKDDRGDYRETYEFTNLGDSIAIQEGKDAINRALAVSGMNPTNICWYYDAVTDYWMVRMFDRENPYIGERQAPYVCDVIMDKHGAVVECYITQFTNDMLIP